MSGRKRKVKLIAFLTTRIQGFYKNLGFFFYIKYGFGERIVIGDKKND